MDNKQLTLRAFGLAAAVGLPIAAFQGYDRWKGTAKAPDAPPPAAMAAAESARAPLPDSSQTPAKGPQAINLVEALSFSATPDWVMRRWPRVSTGLAQLRLQGYRVPLVTGTAENDVAGALTYYFNPQQQVQQITFRGTTGDWRKLAATLTSQHRLTRRLTNDPGLVVFESVHPNGKPASACTIRPVPVVTIADPYHRFDVDLVLERPQG
jgi:hypothetical protein